MRFARARFEITRLNDLLNLKDGIKIIGADKPSHASDRDIVLYLTWDAPSDDFETYVSLDDILSASEASQADPHDEPISA